MIVTCVLFYCEKKVKTVMVNNSTNGNKTKKYLSSQLISLNTKKTTTHDVGDPGPGLGQTQNCGGVKVVNEIPILCS